MRIVIAGSSGLIGTALVSELRKAGHEVVRLVRRAPAGTDERGWDPPAGRLAEDALVGADAVVNLCGTGLADKRWTEARKQALRDSRNTPTEVLATAVAERGVRTLVNASAVGYYGDTGDRVVTEADPNGTGFLAEICHDWEAAAAPAVTGGARVVFARTGLVLSRHGGLLARLRPLFAFGLGSRFGAGRQYWPWIALADEVGALRHVLEHEEVSGPVNLTGPEPVTNAEFTAALGRAMSRPAPWLVPGFAIRAALGAELADEGILAGQRAVPAVLEKSGYRFTQPSLAEALSAAVH